MHYFSSHALSRSRLTMFIALATTLTSGASHGFEIYQHDETVLNGEIEAGYAVFRSRKNYAIVGNRSEGGSSWRESYLKLGLNGSQGLQGGSSLYGGVSGLASGTWGDGDAAGFTEGTERRTALEDAYVGWRSGNLFSSLGQDGLDLSLGRQAVVLGDGFLINNDSVSFGDADLGADFDRGGAYYLAARRAFDKTALLRLGGSDGWRSDIAWLQSDNPAQAKTELTAATLEHVAPAGTVGLTWIHGLDVDERYASQAQLERDGMDTVSLRGMGSLGVENLGLAFEYATQDKRSGRESAWYIEGSWAFADMPWTPVATYRYSRFSEQFDPLFYGMSRGYGTWYQGEVAANYAGPFNSNASVHHVGFKVAPSEQLTLGALGFLFDTRDTSQGDLGGEELDLYAEWMVNDHLVISPVIGLYRPERGASNGGVQLGGSGTNLYSQLAVITFF